MDSGKHKKEHGIQSTYRKEIWKGDAESMFRVWLQENKSGSAERHWMKTSGMWDMDHCSTGHQTKKLQ